MKISFEIGFRRSQLPRRYMRRIKFRNSLVRQQVSGFCSYERIWFAGYDFIFKWGRYDPKKKITWTRGIGHRVMNGEVE
jgi:hypothetical protein